MIYSVAIAVAMVVSSRATPHTDPVASSVFPFSGGLSFPTMSSVSAEPAFPTTTSVLESTDPSASLISTTLGVKVVLTSSIVSNSAAATTISTFSAYPTATSTSSASFSISPRSALTADEQKYLDCHNSLRAMHGAADLTWSDTLAAYAQNWTDGCVFAHSNGVYGENLAAGTGDFLIANATGVWANEESKYDPSNPVYSHFTQMVWKSTTQLGCAVTSCDGIFDASYGKAKYYVCEYNPAGNVIGEFGDNVQV